MANRRARAAFVVDDSWGMQEEKCVKCEKTVYPGDRISVEGKVFHKACFRCQECQGTLSLGSYAALDGQYYCKPHFKQLFKLKGNYSEGFGSPKPTAKWNHTNEGGGECVGDAASQPSSSNEANKEEEEPQQS
ncbi:Xin actin-binding repeat-containing protein 2 [Balamuthia mandrillaris]